MSVLYLSALGPLKFGLRVQINLNVGPPNLFKTMNRQLWRVLPFYQHIVSYNFDNILYSLIGAKVS